MGYLSLFPTAPLTDVAMGRTNSAWIKFDHDLNYNSNNFTSIIVIAEILWVYCA